MCVEVVTCSAHNLGIPRRRTESHLVKRYDCSVQHAFVGRVSRFGSFLHHTDASQLKVGDLLFVGCHPFEDLCSGTGLESLRITISVRHVSGLVVVRERFTVL